MGITIPKKVKIGGLTYKVEITEDLDDQSACGRTYFNKLLIKIEKAQPEFMSLIFLHEVLHTMNAEWDDERIEFLAMALYQFITDNPKVFQHAT